jgi:hypothetical protein
MRPIDISAPDALLKYLLVRASFADPRNIFDASDYQSWPDRAIDQRTRPGLVRTGPGSGGAARRGDAAQSSIRDSGAPGVFRQQNTYFWLRSIRSGLSFRSRAGYLVFE